MARGPLDLKRLAEDLGIDPDQNACTKSPLRSFGSNRAGGDRKRFTGVHGASSC